MENKRGITLIALVLTIIVMIILAGISMSALLGDNGIINQAIKSKENTERSSVKENLQLAWSARMMKFLEETDKPIDTRYLNELLEELNENLGDNKGKIKGIKYNTASQKYVIIYEVNDNNYYTLETTRAGEMDIIEEKTDKETILTELAKDYAVTSDIQEKLATPNEFTYLITDLNAHKADIVGKVGDTNTEVVCPTKVRLNASGELDDTGEEYTVTRIRVEAFKNNNNITKIVLSSEMTEIGGNAFYGSTSIKTVIMSDSVKSIGVNAFRECTSLENVVFSNNLENIYNCAFMTCTSLKNVTLPESLKTISYSAFRECSALTSIIIPKNVTEVGSSVFSSCSSLEEVIFLNDLTSIPGSAFAECRSLTRVVLPSNLERIESYAFATCVLLDNLVIPSTLTTIANAAFITCSSLDTVYFRGTEEEWNNITIENISHNYNTPIMSATKIYNYDGD